MESKLGNHICSKGTIGVGKIDGLIGTFEFSKSFRKFGDYILSRVGSK